MFGHLSAEIIFQRLSVLAAVIKKDTKTSGDVCILKIKMKIVVSIANIYWNISELLLVCLVTLYTETGKANGLVDLIIVCFLIPVNIDSVILNL